MFEVRNIAFSYGSQPILRDVSFFVSPGETVSIVGANGVGKTTLLKVLATLLTPDAGQILTDGHTVRTHSLEYRRQIGYLPERIALYDDMTVKEYLFYRALLKGEPRKRIRRRVGEAVEFCHAGDWLRKTIGTLSAGQRKRVALADTLLLRPRILLLDDFLAGLDRSMRQSTGEILSNAAAFSSVIVTGHEIDDMARWTTRFIVLQDGAVRSTLATAGVEPPVLRAHLEEMMRPRGAAEGEKS